MTVDLSEEGLDAIQAKLWEKCGADETARHEVSALIAEVLIHRADLKAVRHELVVARNATARALGILWPERYHDDEVNQ